MEKAPNSLSDTPLGESWRRRCQPKLVFLYPRAFTILIRFAMVDDDPALPF